MRGQQVVDKQSQTRKYVIWYFPHHNYIVINPGIAENSNAILQFQPRLVLFFSWWRHQMETFSALLTLCAGNSPVTGEFPSQRPVTRSFDLFFHLYLNKCSSKQSWGWWSETPSCSLWRHCTVYQIRVLFKVKSTPNPFSNLRHLISHVVFVKLCFLIRQ